MTKPGISRQVLYVATLIYIFTIPWENALTISGIGTVSRAIGIPLLGLWVACLLFDKSIRMPPAFIFVLGLFVYWCGMTILWNANSEIGIQQTKTFIQLYISVIILWTAIVTPKNCHTALAAYLAGGAVVTSIVIYNYQIGNVTRWDKRASISGVDENDIALTLATCLPIAWYLATTFRSNLRLKFASIMCALFIPFALIAIVMTGSRGGFAASTPFYIYLIFSLKRLKTSSRLITIFFVVVSAIVASSFIPETPLQRIIQTADQLNSRNISGRYDIWLDGLQLWASNAQSFFVGLGVGGYFNHVGRVAHSTYISILVETGTVGFTIFIITIVALLISVLKASPKEKYFCMTVFAIWMIGAISLSWEYRKPTWVIWGLILTLAYSHRYNSLAPTRRTKNSKRPNYDITTQRAR